VAFPADEADRYGVGAARVFCKANAQQLVSIRELVEAGKLKPTVATVLPLAEINQAFDLSEAGRTRGKIVLDVIGQL
jgi:NADPH:quinone reductase-like Zn-dependent oxidoreductase